MGAYDPADELLQRTWGLLAEAGVPVVIHCGSGPAPGKHTGPEPIARVLARHPRLRLPRIPYPYLHQLQALERLDLGPEWLRAVWHDNAGRLFPGVGVRPPRPPQV